MILVGVPNSVSPAEALALPATPAADCWVPNGFVAAIASSGNTVYVGGIFDYVGPNTGCGVPVGMASGEAVPSFARVNDEVRCSVPDGAGGWYIGGKFTRVAGAAREHIAHIMPDGTLDYAWSPTASGAGGVWDIAISGSTVFVTGGFYTMGGKPRSNLAALDAATGDATAWSPTASDGAATAWNPDANDEVWALAISGSTVYAGGYFHTIASQPRTFIAALMASDGAATAWNPNAEEYVFAMAVSGDKIYVGGRFFSLGGVTRNGIYAMDAVSGRPTPWNPNPDTDSIVFNIKVDGSAVYVGGLFDEIGGPQGCASQPWTPPPETPSPGIPVAMPIFQERG